MAQLEFRTNRSEYPDVGTPKVVDTLHALAHLDAVKTANNVLAVLSVMLRTAAEWGVMERIPCSIKMLPTMALEWADFARDKSEVWSVPDLDS